MSSLAGHTFTGLVVGGVVGIGISWGTYFIAPAFPQWFDDPRKATPNRMGFIPRPANIIFGTAPYWGAIIGAGVGANVYLTGT